jgi:glucose-1-phosphate adenylyltransferase
VNTPPTVAFVMAGGEGRRLLPLTADCPKPALPFGRYRLIDFALASLYHSGLRSIYVLAQYRLAPLLDHLAHAWRLPPDVRGEFIHPILPGSAPFRGTADAVRQALARVDPSKSELVAVFAADHVYRMDVRQMIAFHRSRSAAATVSAVRVPISAASEFGVLSVDPAWRVDRFDEKPGSPASVPGDPQHVLASMGNYLFRTEVLLQVLADAERRNEHDFGRHVLPRLVDDGLLHAYDFADNQVPGLQSYEERAYWRDVGTVEAYVAAHRDTIGPRPRFNLNNPLWPIQPLAREPDSSERLSTVRTPNGERPADTPSTTDRLVRFAKGCEEGGAVSVINGGARQVFEEV